MSPSVAPLSSHISGMLLCVLAVGDQCCICLLQLKAQEPGRAVLVELCTTHMISFQCRYTRDWRKIQQHIKTKTAVQVCLMKIVRPRSTPLLHLQLPILSSWCCRCKASSALTLWLNAPTDPQPCAEVLSEAHQERAAAPGAGRPRQAPGVSQSPKP